MRADDLTGFMQGPQLRPSHVAWSITRPAHGDEKPRRQSARQQNGQRLLVVREVAVVESELRPKAAVFAASHLGKELDMLFKLFCFNYIGVLTPAWPQLVVEKINAVQGRRCSFFRD